MSSVRYASGKKRSTAPLIQTGEYPPQLDASIAKGAWVIGPDGNMFYSNGEDWLPSLPQGVEVIIPPWVQVPDGWFAVSASLTGDLANRTVIANRFDISYVLDGAKTWPIIDPSNLYQDSAGETPVVSAPEPVGLVEDSTVPQINWFQDVSVDRPQWKQITRTVDGVEKTIDVLEFDNLGQQLKVDFPDPVTGSMVHVTSNGIYILGVDIPAGEYNFGRYQIWDIEEIILLDRSLTSGEAVELISELGKQRDRVTEPNFGTDWTNAFRDRPEIMSMPSFDFTGVVNLRSAFRNAGADNWLSGSFLDTAVDVTNFFETFRDNNLTSIPAGLFDNTPNVTSFTRTFDGNNLTSIPDNLFDNTPNVTTFRETFRSNDLTSVPAGLFDTQTQATNYDRVFEANDLDETSVDNVLVSIAFSATENDLDNGIIGIDGGTNSPPGTAGNDAIAALEAKGWTVNVNT